MQTLLAILSVAGYLLTLTLLPMVLLTKKRESVATVAWMMAIVTMPYFGAFLFIVFGINRVGRRVQSRLAAMRSASQSVPQLAGHHHLSESRLNETQRELWQLAERVAPTRATVGNSVQLLTDAQQTFNDIAAAIESANAFSSTFSS